MSKYNYTINVLKMAVKNRKRNLREWELTGEQRTEMEGEVTQLESDIKRLKRGRMRESVKWFADGMEEALKESDHKGGWEQEGLIYLFGRLNEEVGELESSIPSSEELLTPRGVDVMIKECHDIANLAHMIADNAKRLKEKS